MSDLTLLTVRDLRVAFPLGRERFEAVAGVDFSLARGEIVGLVGESGSGKSLTAASLMRLVPPPGRITSGEVVFDGHDLLRLPIGAMRAIRGARIALIPQDPMTTLNPVLSIGQQMSEMIEAHQNVGHRAALDQAVALLGRVGIPDPAARLASYPHQLSGGMRQRVMIAMALSCGPDLLIADEPTTALDVTIQAQIIALVREMQAERGITILWITHDMGVVASLAQRLLVLYAGRIVEEGPVEALYRDPRHPYTIGLLRALPRLDRPPTERLLPIPGAPPLPGAATLGCAFAPRCAFAQPRCVAERPPLEAVDGGQRVACWVKPHMNSVPERAGVAHD